MATNTQSHANIFAMSVRNPWAYLIAKGYKKIENRHTGISSDKLDQPVALHVAKKSYPESERHGYYQLPIVQKYLSMDEQTKDIYHDNSKLDALFEQMSGCIIAVIYIENTVKSKSTECGKDSFADIPKASKYYWMIANTHYLREPIANFSGCLGVRLITDESVVAALRQFLREINETESKEQHLCVPQCVMQNAATMLMRADGFRMIYDSDQEMQEAVDDLDEAETESEQDMVDTEDVEANKENINVNVSRNSIEQYVATILSSYNDCFIA